MQQSPSGDAGSISAVKNLSRLLWTWKMYYRLHKRLQLCYRLSKFNPAHTSFPICIRSILILSFGLCQELPRGLFPSGYRTENLYAILIAPVCAAYRAHPLLCDLVTLMLMEYKS
jgi:hypothetical protein